VTENTPVPAVRCDYCGSHVDWSEIPAHLSDHGGDLEIRAVVVEGEEPKKRAIGEPDDGFVRIWKKK